MAAEAPAAAQAPPAGQPHTVGALIDAAARTRPDDLYFVATDTGRTLTYAGLRRACGAFASLLDARGVPPGGIVSLMMPNGLQTVLTMLGTMAAGRCVNPVNLLAQPGQMRYVIDHSGCRLLVVAPDWEARARALLDGIDRPIGLLVLDPDGQAPPEVPDGQTPPEAAVAACVLPASVAQPSAPAVLMYTSGTTGRPKGVLLTQASLVANACAISREHGLGPADRVLAVLPLYHINALVVTMLAPIAHGGSLAMPPRFSAARFWEQAVGCGCTWINVVPTMVSYLLEGPAPAVDLSGIRFCRSASAALPAEHHRAFEQRFGIGIIETMGLTETAAPSFSNPREAHERRVGSVGRASGGEARVVDEQGGSLPDGTVGEIVVRGPHVMAGYHRDPQATAAAFFPDGWLRTGDQGYRDADGFFFVTGRLKELIIKGGENIAPREIDEALMRHPAVAEAACVGIPDRHYGQEILACVRLRDGQPCTEADLRAFCIEQLGPYRTPKLFRFVDDLPRGPSGKVQRLRLLEPTGEAP